MRKERGKAVFSHAGRSLPGGGGMGLFSVFRPGTAGLPHADAFQRHAVPHGVIPGAFPFLFQRMPGVVENGAGHHFARGVFPVKRNNAFPVGGHESGVIGILRIDAQGMVKLLEKIPHHLLDGFEIHHHVIGVQRIRPEHHLHGACMAMGEFAVAGMLGQEVPAFQFNGFANSVDHELRISLRNMIGNIKPGSYGSCRDIVSRVFAGESGYWDGSSARCPVAAQAMTPQALSPDSE